MSHYWRSVTRTFKIRSLQVAPKNLDRRCRAIAKNGKRCRAAATEGGLCFFHGSPNKSSELGRIGGRSKVRALPEPADPLPPLDNAVAVREAMARVIAEARAGKLPTQRRGRLCVDVQSAVALVRGRGSGGANERVGAR
jgi:hypothetical protein